MTVAFDGEAIARATGGVLVRPGPSGPIVTDSRSFPTGAWFLALVGTHFDGHAFLPTVARSAAGCVVQRDPGPDFPGGVVVVADTTRAYQALGLAARRAFAGPVIGLTGSSGKTTTRTLVALALEPLGLIHQTVANLNNHIGVPLTLLSQPSAAAAMVVEMGTSAPGEIEVLARAAEPDVRLIVNVGPAHLQELGGLDGVAREKGALFATARAGDVVCVNVDDPRVAALPVPYGVRVLRWGCDARADVRLSSATIDPARLSTHARWDTPQGEVSAELPAPGVHVAHDATGALCCALALGVDLTRSAEAMARYEPVGMRLRSELLPGGARALNDAYNANPASMEASMRLLASLPGRRGAVLGDMLELGPQEADWHRQIAALAGSLRLDRVWFLGARMSAAAPVCSAPHAAFLDPDLAGEAVRDWATSGDVVLFKGSRGARVERVLQRVQGKPPGEAH